MTQRSGKAVATWLNVLNTIKESIEAGKAGSVHLIGLADDWRISWEQPKDSRERLTNER